MPNYFDYIKESAEVEVNSPEDIDEIYNEMDVSICEFDTYVQEGVGLKILIGIGVAAALAGLVALIIKLFKKHSEKGAKKATDAAKKEATKAKGKHGGDAKVPKKRKTLKAWVLSKINKTKKKEFEESFSYDFDEDIFQEAVDSDAGTNFIKAINEETALVIDLAGILTQGYKGDLSYNACMQKARTRINGTPDTRMATTKMSDYIEAADKTYTIDDIIEECELCALFNKKLSEMAIDLKKAQDALNKAAAMARDNAKNGYNEDRYNAMSKLDQKIAMPVVTKLQAKIVAVNDAILSVMTENIKALQIIGAETDNIKDSVKANGNAFEFEDNLHKI